MKKILFLLGTALLPVVGFSQTIIGHWNFSGGAANDVSGNGLNGTIYGGVTAAAGQAGVANTALKFDGSTGYVRVPGNSLLNLSQWTIQAVVKPTGFYSGTCQGNVIVWHGQERGPDFYMLEMFDNAYDNSCSVYSPTKEVFAGSAAGTNSITWPTTSFIQQNTWYCVTLTYANDVLSLYVNGNLIISANSPNVYNYTGTPADLFFGSSNNNTGLYPYWFNGVIDDITIWNGQLSQPLIAGFCTKVSENSWRSTGVAEVKEVKKTTIVPNPANNLIKVTLPQNWNEASIQVINSVGQTLMTQELSSNEATIDIHALPAGMYILKVAHDQEVSNEKFMKN